MRRFLRKVATHSLNSLQENREEFTQKYMQKYQDKLNEVRAKNGQDTTAGANQVGVSANDTLLKQSESGINAANL